MTYFKGHPRLSHLILRVAKHVFLWGIAILFIPLSMYAHPLAKAAVDVIDKIIYSGKCMQDRDSDVWLPYEPEDDINVIAEEAIASYKQQCDMDPNVIYLYPDDHPEITDTLQGVPVIRTYLTLSGYVRASWEKRDFGYMIRRLRNRS